MIRKIGFKNYKSFKNYTELELRRMTILVGPNSSGKSSIIKLIKLITQSFLGVSQDSPLMINGPLVNHYEYERLFFKNANKISVNILTPIRYEAYDNSIPLKFSENNFLETKIELYKKERKARLFFNGNISDIYFNENIKFSYEYDGNNFIFNTTKEIIKEFSKFINRNKLKKIFDETFQKILDIEETSKQRTFLEEIIDVSQVANFTMFPDNLFPQSLENVIWPEEFFRFETEVLEENYCLLKKSFIYDETYEKFSKMGIETDYSQMNLDKSATIKILKESLLKLIELNNRKSKQFQEEIVDSVVNVFYTILYNLEKDYLISLNKKIVAILQQTLREVFSKLQYISPVRDVPKRVYTKGEIEKYFDFYNFNLRDAFYFKSGILNELPHGIYRNLKNSEGKINYYLHKLNINSSFEIRELTENTLIEEKYSIILKDKVSKKEFFLEETGFGISQILPILYSLSFYKSYLRFIEQPELHLHPNIQFKLSEIFTEKINYSKNSNRFGAGNDYSLIETHSEHLVRGIQIEVAKGNLKPEDVAVYYVDKDKKGVSSARLLELDENGNFTTEWPSGFMDLSSKAAYELLNTQLKNKSK